MHATQLSPANLSPEAILTASIRPTTSIRSPLPPEVAEKLRPLADLLAEEVVREIRRNVPAYSRPFRARDHDSLIGATRLLIHKRFDALRRPQTQQTDWNAVFRQVGRVEFTEGRTMDALQAATRVSAQVAWRWFSVNTRSIGMPAETLLTMANDIFAWMNELSAVTIEGYHQAQAEATQVNTSDAREHARRDLARALLSGDPAEQERARTLAEAASWPVPDRLVPIAVERLRKQDELGGLGAHPEALVDLGQTPACVLLPHSGRNRRLISDLLGDRRAAVGPAVAPAEAHRSLALARRMLELTRTKAVAAGRIAWCQDHLATMVVLADPFLTAQLREHADALFAGLTPKQRSRMATTLLAWLENRGTANDLAARLDVHPQTVRYRIHQLQDLLGEKLVDPDSRLTLELALRAHVLRTRGAFPSDA